MSSASVDGQWGTWGQWGRCSKQCGGSQIRVRLCEQQKNGGRFCVGNQTQEQTCNTASCDLDQGNVHCCSGNMPLPNFFGL